MQISFEGYGRPLKNVARIEEKASTPIKVVGLK
jgi:hypothetical protein